MKKYEGEFTPEQIGALIESYYIADNYQFASTVDTWSYEKYSSQILYSLVRDFKPISCLEFGTYHGGSVSVACDALLKNNKPFKYVAGEIEKGNYDKTVENLTNWHGKLIPELLFGDIATHEDKIPKELDFVFIDSNHDIDNCNWYLENVFPRLKDEALVMIHDWSVHTIDGKLVYDGGSFPEIVKLKDMYEQKTLPLKKLYWTWDYPENRAQGRASSFWQYDKSKEEICLKSL